jgi:hypothetical protein
MANGNGAQPSADHRKLIIIWVGALGAVAFLCGTVLIFKGYHGDLLIGGGLASISGLVGFLSAGKPTQPQPDISVSTDPPKAEINQPKPEPQAFQ